MTGPGNVMLQPWISLSNTFQFVGLCGLYILVPLDIFVFQYILVMFMNLFGNLLNNIYQSARIFFFFFGER